MPVFRLVSKLDCLLFMRLDALCAMLKAKTSATVPPTKMQTANIDSIKTGFVIA